MEGWSKGVNRLGGSVAESQASESVVAEAIVSLSSSFFSPLSCSPPVSLTIAFFVDSWASISLLSLSPSLFFHTQAADRRTGAMMDDALSESDNIFSQSLKQDQAVWDAGQRWPLSVFVRSNCCVQSPLSRPPYQLHGACANWSWPHGPASQNLHSGYATASGQHLTTFQPCDFSLFLFVTGRKTVLWDHKQQQSLHMKSSSPVRRFSLSVCKQIHKDFYKPLNNSYNNACIFIINKFTNSHQLNSLDSFKMSDTVNIWSN